MKALDILNADITIAKKIEYLKTSKPENFQKYIDYYNGKQAVKDRVHPTDPIKTAKLNKLVFNLYKKITDTAVYFLFGKSPELVLNNPDKQKLKLFEEFKKSYNDAKPDIINNKIGVETLGYSESAEYIYAKENKIKYQLLSTENEELYPFFDEKGNMDAFMRIYMLNEFIDLKIRKVEYTEIYTQNEMFKYRKFNNVYEQITMYDKDEKEVSVLKYDKIPIIYYSVKEPLAWQVKDLLDRFNLMSSTLGDVNDYFAFPILMLIGQLVKDLEDNKKKYTEEEEILVRNITGVLNLAGMDESGDKVTADAKYLVWSQRPESAIFELENLKQFILHITSTADLSLENLKGLRDISGVALLLMFTDSIAQSKINENIFFKLQRRINVHKSILNSVSLPKNKYDKLDISMKFQNPLPENVKELIENLSNAKMSGILSTDTAIANNPFVKNVKNEKELIDADNSLEGGSFNL